jgi:hypothetical protein
MTWSLLNVTKQDAVKSLLDDIENCNVGRPDFTPALPREKVESIIHALIWLLACRGSDTAAAYASDALYYSLGDETIEWLISRRDFEARMKAMQQEPRT